MRRLLLLAVATAGLALAGCGTDPNDPVPSPEPVEDGVAEVSGTDDDLVAAVEAYARTKIEGDPDEVVAARSEGCAVVETDLAAPPDDVRPEDVTVSDVDADVDGDVATVDYRLDPAGEQIADERWVREDGEWKWDNC